MVSTWTGEEADDLGADCVVYSEDPGPTIFVYSKKNDPVHVNINRQVVSTVEGLLRVKTKYAAKLRADNILHKTEIMSLFEQFPKRAPQYSVLNNRLICSNFFAKEFEKGLRVPYFFSDFFQFGETDDLLMVWQSELHQDYPFNSKFSGKKQHEDYPNDSVNVEQRIWTNFINKFEPTHLNDEHGCWAERTKSYKYMLNNLMIVDGDILGLEVPKRLEQSNGYPFDLFSFQRWRWLYGKEFGEEASTSLIYKVHWYFSVIIKGLKKE
ncbi:WavE lipopolysaccharide synthesis family protein [Vibrio lamellibrachiae]